MAGGWRDGPLNIALPVAAPITAMISLPDYLLVLQAGRSYRVRNPQGVDPERQNLALPWAVELGPIAGSSDHVVARILVQTKRLIEAAMLHERFSEPQLFAQLVELIGQIKACELAFVAIRDQVEAIFARIERGEIFAINGVVNGVPQVELLNDSCTQFLVCCKRAIRIICYFAGIFGGVRTTHSNFDRLHEDLLASPHAASVLSEFVGETKDQVHLLIDFRNFQEHPSEQGRTVVQNVMIQRDGVIGRPTIRVDGVNSRPEYGLVTALSDALNFLTDCAEGIIFHGVMLNRNTRFGYEIRDIPADERNPACPIRFSIRPIPA